MAGNSEAAIEPRTDELMNAVLRRMSLGNIHLSELEVALQAGDCFRMVAAAASLHDTWTSAEYTIAILLDRSSRRNARSSTHRHYDVARSALLASRFFARDSLTRMWSMLRDDAKRRAAGSAEPSPSISSEIGATGTEREIAAPSSATGTTNTFHAPGVPA
jgi:hypothetical protein